MADICILCSEEIEGYGNNPSPLASVEESCCDCCYQEKVIPARLKVLDNPDKSSFLAPRTDPNSDIVFGDEFQDRGGEVVPDFDATRSELCAIVKAHLIEILDKRAWIFFHDQCGSRDYRHIQYLWLRVDRLAEILGDDEIESIRRNVEGELRDKLGDRGWEIFNKQLVDERDRLLEEQYGATQNENNVNNCPSERIFRNKDRKEKGLQSLLPGFLETID